MANKKKSQTKLENYKYEFAQEMGITKNLKNKIDKTDNSK